MAGSAPVPEDRHDLDRITRRFRRIMHLLNVLIVLVVLWVLARAISPKLSESAGRISAVLMTGALVVLSAIHSYSIRKTRVEDIVRIRFLTAHDGLTQVYNLRYLRQRMDEEIGRARRYNRSVCVLYMDLDRFKKVNDTYGHRAGDRVLVTVAQLLRDMCRVPDMVARVVGRIGGDEFLILLPETDVVGGGKFACRVLEKIRDLSVDLEDGRHVDFVGVSIGIAAYPADAQDRAGLLDKADSAMYHAKRAGGNRFSDTSGEVRQAS